MKKITTKFKLNKIDRKVYTQGLLLGFISLFGAFFFALYFVVQIVLNKYQAFLKSASLSNDEFITLVKSIDYKKETTNQTFLILGTDSLENRPGFPQLSDTMIVVQVNPSNSEITTLPLPRDLWSEAYKTKINALYEYGKERNSEVPTEFPREVVSEMIGQNIDHVFVISLSQLAEIIDLLGYIELDVKEGFVDEKFPRTDVDITIERDPAKLYETVEFKSGVQSMDGQTALKYIRSRNSTDSNFGNDIDRSSRQQQVITAIVERVSNPKLFWYYPQLAGELLKFYNNNFNQYLKFEEAVALGINLVKNSKELTISGHSLPIYPNEIDGVIEHPTNLTPYQNQWVYIIKNQDSFEQFIKTALNQ